MKKILRFLLALIVVVVVFTVMYEIPRKTIKVKQAETVENGIKINSIAKELIVQDVSHQGVWASRGFDLYFKDHSEKHFRRVSRIPVPLGISYILGFRTFRYIMNKQEVMELLAVNERTIVVFAGGFIFRSADGGRSFHVVDKIEHYGFKKGRGILPQGYTVDENGNIYWGEYWRNETRSAVRLFKSEDEGESWEPIKIFDKEEIRHIHAVQYDPYFDAIWVATGDSDNECKILYSTDQGETFIAVGYGNQKWRAVSLMFGERKVYWGMDGFTDEIPLQVWSWDRETKESESVLQLGSYAFYSTVLDEGSLVLSTDGLLDSATLWVFKKDSLWQQAARWDRKLKNHYGTIRMQSYNDILILSNINLIQFNNDLVFAELK